MYLIRIRSLRIRCRSAESAYRRMIDEVRMLPKLPLATDEYIHKNIRRIDYVENAKLSETFRRTKERFGRSDISAEVSEVPKPFFLLSLTILTN
jgi:hypothetical protein